MGGLNMQFKPTKEMKNAARDVFIKMAVVETIRPVVLGYETAILADMKPQSKHDHKIITEPKYAWTMTDKNFKIYLNCCNEERIKAGLKVKSQEYCPLLVAEDNLRVAETHLIEVMAPISHLTLDMLLESRDCLNNLRKAIDLNLQLLAPYVKGKVSIPEYLALGVV
jgi:hypothetical protein